MMIRRRRPRMGIRKGRQQGFSGQGEGMGTY
jgi:hypothetical protein